MYRIWLVHVFHLHFKAVGPRFEWDKGCKKGGRKSLGGKKKKKKKVQSSDLFITFF